MTEWKEYTGSDEQIKEMLSSETGFIVDSQSSVFRDKAILKYPITENNRNWLTSLLDLSGVKKYLICEPHPLADVICKQARTGQPVYIKTNNCKHPVPSKMGDRVLLADSNDMHIGEIRTVGVVTTRPDWDIPNAEYSFTPFED